MPAHLTNALDPGDRKLMYIVGVVFLLIVVATLFLAPPSGNQGDEIPSTYSSTSGGARAAYLLLKDLNYHVERWEQPATELPEKAGDIVLILANPQFPFSADENHAVHEFLRRGGVILATGLSSVRVLPGEAALPDDPLAVEWKTFSPRLPSPLTRGADKIELRTSAHWAAQYPSHLVLYGDDEKMGVVITYREGAGRVIWWASPAPLTNRAISASKNLTLFLNALGRPGQKRILWDEYSQGQRGSIWDYLARTPVPWGALQIGLVALALLFTFGRRSGPVRPLVKPSRLTSLEFVDTLGGLYYRAHAAHSAVSAALQRFRFLLARRLGQPVTTGAVDLARSARERLGTGALQLDDTLRRAERAARQPQLTDADALELVQSLDDYAARLALKRAAGQVSQRAAQKAATPPPEPRPIQPTTSPSTSSSTTKETR